VVGCCTFTSGDGRHVSMHQRARDVVHDDALTAGPRKAGASRD
jgi:hypothetical protein